MLAGQRIALIGECLIELSGTAFGALRQAYGGDTLNTAVYLARLLQRQAAVHYVTVLGGDSLSERMLASWHEEGIDTAFVLRDAERLPGVYQIEVDAAGERRFLYWRQNSAARQLLRHPAWPAAAEALAAAQLIYLSGISLAILPEDDRARLIQRLLSLAERGAHIAFDTNYRPVLWSSVAVARECVGALLPGIGTLFTTQDDEAALWGAGSAPESIARYTAAGSGTVIVKQGPAGCTYGDGLATSSVPTIPVRAVVDTTAAGDSFNAAYLAALLHGRDPDTCCKAGNTLAGVVIQHRGAVIDAASMPNLRALLT